MGSTARARALRIADTTTRIVDTMERIVDTTTRIVDSMDPQCV